MIYKKTLRINKAEADMIDHYLMVEPKDWSECLSENETISHTVVFDDGKEMDIKCCGVQFRDGESNTAWTEAILFDNGSEVCFTEPCDSYLGEWELESDGNKYVVEVVSN